MKKILVMVAAFCAAGFGAWAQDDENSGLECTSIVVGRLASTDGSVMTSHTCDGTSHTWVNIVPAKDHKPGSVTPIRKNWRKTKFVTDTAGIKIVGEIPQVAHTYSYVNTGYPSLNEKQVGIGETTFTGPDTLINHDAPLVIEELCRLAMERSATAREAVKVMGSLAEEYGYGDGGECLTVSDPKEVWQLASIGSARPGLRRGFRTSTSGFPPISQESERLTVLIQRTLWLPITLSRWLSTTAFGMVRAISFFGR